MVIQWSGLILICVCVRLMANLFKTLSVLYPGNPELWKHTYVPSPFVKIFHLYSILAFKINEQNYNILRKRLYQYTLLMHYWMGLWYLMFNKQWRGVKLVFPYVYFSRKCEFQHFPATDKRHGKRAHWTSSGKIWSNTLPYILVHFFWKSRNYLSKSTVIICA